MRQTSSQPVGIRTRTRYPWSSVVMLAAIGCLLGTVWWLVARALGVM
jgi:hypothetical protein